MKKKIILLLLVLPAFLFAQLRFINPVGPTLVPIAQLLSSDISSEVPGLQISLWRSVDEAISSIVGRKAEISLLPVTVGAKLASAGIDIKLAAISMWNGFYFISSEKEIETVEDLRGYDIYTLQAPGQTADIILKGAAEEKGLKAGSDFGTVYVGGAEAVQLLATGRAKIILVPEPFATLAQTRVQDAKRSMPIEELWSTFNEDSIDIPTSGLFVAGTVDRDIVDMFLLLYSQSMSLSLADRAGTAAIVSERMGGFPIPVLEKAIEGIGFRFVPAGEARREVEIYLEKLGELDPELTGDVDLDDFFY